MIPGWLLWKLIYYMSAVACRWHPVNTNFFALSE
jgi:hypothetical protein